MLAATALAGVSLAGGANASLITFATFTGNELVSMDGCGSSTATCTLQSNLQAGSTIQAAFLYSSTFNSTVNPNGVTLSLGANSVAPTFSALGVNGNLQAWRANVTAFVEANAQYRLPDHLDVPPIQGGATNAESTAKRWSVVYSNAAAGPTATVRDPRRVLSSGGTTSISPSPRSPPVSRARSG